MNREEILSHVDHTLLKPEATWPQIQTLCDEAIANHTASVCINTCYVKQAVEYMAGRCKVKAAGGISTVDDMEKVLALGADRLGTSRAVKILNGEQAKGY